MRRNRHNPTFQSGKESVSSSSKSPSPGSQEFQMDQKMRTAIAAAAAPTETRVFHAAFWRENSNKATKKMQTLIKAAMITIDS